MKHVALIILPATLAGCVGDLVGFADLGQPTPDTVYAYTGILEVTQLMILQSPGEDARSTRTYLSGAVEFQLAASGVPVWAGQEIVPGLERGITVGGLDLTATANKVAATEDRIVVDYTLTGLIIYDTPAGSIPLRVDGEGQDVFTPGPQDQIRYSWTASVEHSDSGLYVTIDYDGAANLQQVGQ
jgi:hypothetical protein